MSRSVDLRPCPGCGADLPPEQPGFVSWCPSCEWNLDPDPEREEPSGRLARWDRRLNDRLVAGMYARLAGKDVGRPGWDGARVGAYAIAALVHLFTLGMLVLGCWLVFVLFNVVSVLVGAACLALVALLRPRLGRVPKDATRLRRDQAPRLYALVDEVAAAVGGRRVHLITLSPAFNASFARVGPRQRRVLDLGLPLWTILAPGERVALLGHELGHDVNGDFGRSLPVHSSMTALSELHGLLRGGVGRSRPNLFSVEALANSLMWLLSWPVLAVLVVQYRLHLRTGQRAEYHADSLAAKAAGSRDAERLLDKLVLGESVEFALHTAAVRREADLWSSATTRYATLPDTEFERLRRIATRDGHRSDSTHPPTGLRVDLVAGRPASAPAVRLTEADSAGIDAEIAPFLGPITRRIRDSVVG